MNQQQEVAEFAAKLIPNVEKVEDWGPCFCLGFTENGKLIAAVVFHRFIGFDVNLSIAATSPRWATPQSLAAIFRVAYEYLGVKRMTCIVGKRNRRARKLVEGTGFKLEGVMRSGYDGKQNAIIYGMMKDECKWLERSHGVQLFRAATGTVGA